MMHTDLIAEIKSRVQLAQLVSNYVQVRKSGNNFVCCCPFPDHSDGTPSFYIRNERYKCFGCGRTGDVINFVQTYMNMTTSQAVKHLAQQAGIAMHSSIHKSHRVNPLRYTLNAAQQLYTTALSQHRAALHYLQSRGINDPARYNIGWCGNGLLPEASTELLQRTGLVKNGRAFFYNRVMFPVSDSRGICGFGGRVISADAKPKYLNSPQTELFDKSKLLYSPSHVGKNLFLVEGYIDAIALSQHGMRAIAPMGTSISEHHLEDLWRIDTCIYLAFDGDTAGQHALERCINLALPHLSHNRQIKIITLPSNTDPAQILYTEGIERWNQLCASARDVIDFLWNHVQGSPEKICISLKTIHTQIERIQDPTLKSQYQKAIGSRPIKQWKPTLKVAPTTSKIQQIFGILSKNQNLCGVFQEEIAQLQLTGSTYEQLKQDALLIAANKPPSSTWLTAGKWCCRVFTYPEDILRHLFAHYSQSVSHTTLQTFIKEYQRNPTPDNWTRILNASKPPIKS